MEVLWKYGSDEQKRSGSSLCWPATSARCFFMTEPDVVSSDATNMAATAVIDGDHTF